MGQFGKAVAHYAIFVVEAAAIDDEATATVVPLVGFFAVDAPLRRQQPHRYGTSVVMTIQAHASIHITGSNWSL